MEKLYTAGELARWAGVSARTIRFYEVNWKRLYREIERYIKKASQASPILSL